MANIAGNIHGGCSAFLIDVYVFLFSICMLLGRLKKKKKHPISSSSLALVALRLYQTGLSRGSVSQALNVVYHSPATM